MCKVKKEQCEMLKRMLKDCVPTMIALSFSGLYSVIDGLFIGTAAGDPGLAAINLAWPIPALITATGLGIGTGGSILFSNSKGKKGEESGYGILYMTLVLLFLSSLLTTVLLGSFYPVILRLLGAEGEVLIQAQAYSRLIILGSFLQIGGAGLVPLLRNLSMPVQAMAAMICGMICNCIFNYLLIMRCRMGIRGAAIGTVTAQGIVCMICFLYMIKTVRASKRGKPVASLAGFGTRSGQILKTGLPAFGVSLAPTVVLMFTNRQCLRLGGEQAVAAYAVISYLVFPFQSLLQGIGEGLQPLMSYYMGAGKEEESARLKRYAYCAIGMLGVLLWGLSWLIAGRIGGWFHLSEGARLMCKEGFFISAFSFLFYGYSKFHISYMNSRLRVREANALIYGESLLVSPLLIYGLPVLWGLYGIWLSLPLTSIMMLVIFFGGQRIRKR